MDARMQQVVFFLKQRLVRASRVFDPELSSGSPLVAFPSCIAVAFSLHYVCRCCRALAIVLDFAQYERDAAARDVYTVQRAHAKGVFMIADAPYALVRPGNNALNIPIICDAFGEAGVDVYGIDILHGIRASHKGYAITVWRENTGAAFEVGILGDTVRAFELRVKQP